MDNRNHPNQHPPQQHPSEDDLYEDDIHGNDAQQTTEADDGLYDEEASYDDTDQTDGEMRDDGSQHYPEFVEEDYEEDVVEEPEPAPQQFADGAGLCATKLGKSYKKRKVVSDVSLNVHRGEAVGLLGPNGAGKTTSFYMIVGLVQPDHGTITLDDADITQLPMYRRARLGVGYLPQEASIFRGLSVEDNILAALEVIESDPDKRQDMLDQLLDEFGITRLRKSPSLALSGGERRRLEIARALASQPNYILLDEPFAGVDPIAVSEIRELVSHLKDRGIGVLITDHNVRETLGVIDRAYIMHSGTVLTQGLPEEIVQHEGVRRVYLGENFSL